MKQSLIVLRPQSPLAQMFQRVVQRHYGDCAALKAVIQGIGCPGFLEIALDREQIAKPPQTIQLALSEILLIQDAPAPDQGTIGFHQAE